MSTFNDQPSKREGQWYPSRPVGEMASASGSVIGRCPRCQSVAKWIRGDLRDGQMRQYYCDHQWHDEPVKAMVKVNGKRAARAVGR